MNIKWLGHAAFLITSSDGIRIITDPYGKYPGLNYKPIEESADIVVISHQHGDHAGGDIKGDPVIVTNVGIKMIKGIFGFENAHGRMQISAAQIRINNNDLMIIS